MAKDDVELICDIGELAGIYDETRDLANVLNNAVSMIAFHMKAAVCSIYLYDPVQDTLRLAANQGLAAGAVGKVMLSSNEGLTGKALRELGVINVGRASDDPDNKHVPGIDEERFESYLAMPILRGLIRIGVLVVQDTVPFYFRENDERALRAISSQIARIIENADTIRQAHVLQNLENEAVARNPIAFESELFRGQSAAKGLAFGEAFLMDQDEYDVLISSAEETEPFTVDDFRRAVATTAQQLADLQTSVMENFSDVASQIFLVQVLLLKDRQLLEPIEEMIAKGEDPDRAITAVFNELIDVFARLDKRVFQEKKQDLKDLGHRLLANLHGHTDEHADYTGKIVIAEDLLPSDIVKLSAQNAAGLIVTQGTVVSHIAIIARSLNIPLVFTEQRRLLQIIEDTPIILDAIEGNIFVHPTEEVRNTFLEQRKAFNKAESLATEIDEETYTSDGARICLLANINLLNDVAVAKTFKAEGVGLYRSEVPFLVRSEFPSEEAQYRIYDRIVKEMDQCEVVFRTLDIGGDKVLPYHRTDEANPFMGLRAIRFSLRNKMIFKIQLNALLRAGAKRIMFPFISSLDDFIAARAVVRECLVELAQQGRSHCEFPEIGTMIELPAAVEIIDELAEESDFLSIGTNDLVQYMLAVDRTNENVRDFYVPYHPAVLRALKKIADAGIKHRIDVCVCGDIARDARMIPFLLGIGLKKLSMNPRAIPDVQRQIKSINLGQATNTARNMLTMGRVSEIRHFLEE